MKIKKSAQPLIALTVLIIAALACGSSDSNSGQVVGNATTAPTSAPVQLQTHAVGEIIQVENHTIVLNSYEFQDSTLKANFTIENLGSEDLNVSSLLSFTAKDTEGTKLEMEIFDCGTSSLDGTVLPGDKLKGDICWSGANTDTIKIYYEASLLGSGAVVWAVTK
jgi:hypothetical protein